MLFDVRVVLLIRFGIIQRKLVSVEKQHQPVDVQQEITGAPKVVVVDAQPHNQLVDVQYQKFGVKTVVLVFVKIVRLQLPAKLHKYGTLDYALVPVHLTNKNHKEDVQHQRSGTDSNVVVNVHTRDPVQEAEYGLTQHAHVNVVHNLSVRVQNHTVKMPADAYVQMLNQLVDVLVHLNGMMTPVHVHVQRI